MEMDEPTTLVDCVEKSITDYISSNKLVPGDKLPSEEEFAQELSVSRSAVREALSRLRFSGMLTSRKKRGIVLTAIDPARLLAKNLSPRMMDKRTVVDLLELRLWMENAIIPDIFRYVNDSDIADLEKILSEEPEKPDTLLSVDHEIRFHCRIFEISGNRTAAGLQKAFLPLYRHVRENYDEFAALGLDSEKSPASHRDILNAIKHRDSSEYALMISSHLHSYSTFVENFHRSL